VDGHGDFFFVTGFIQCSNKKQNQLAVKPNRMECDNGFLATWFLVSCLTYPFTLQKEAVHSSRTSADFYWTTKHYMPGESIFIGSACHLLVATILLRLPFDPKGGGRIFPQNDGTLLPLLV
jgi:hypothetical protein